MRDDGRVTDDTTGDTAPTSRHIGVWIDAPPEVVYAFASDPQQMPRWAAGLAAGELRRSGEGWVADSPMGQVTVEFAPVNEFGVIDHVVRLPNGEAVYNALRVVPAGIGVPRCEVVFTARQRDGMTHEEFEADIAAVRADLQELRRLLER